MPLFSHMFLLVSECCTKSSGLLCASEHKCHSQTAILSSSGIFSDSVRRSYWLTSMDVDIFAFRRASLACASHQLLKDPLSFECASIVESWTPLCKTR